MARDHRRLRVFIEAQELALAIYKHTQAFPREEWFGLRAQMRRAAVSVASNIVEGNARRTTRAYINFLNVARGSAAELDYLLELAANLAFVLAPISTQLKDQCQRVIRQLEALIRRMEGLQVEEVTRRPK